MSTIERSPSPLMMDSFPLTMAGRAFTLSTDSPRLAELTAGFFPPTGEASANYPCATLTLLRCSRRETAPGATGFPVFRGRNEFVHADYGSDGSVWFDLKARSVLGIVSDEFIADAELFRRTVLTVIAGVLAPALGLVGLHAGCVVRDGKAVLLAAASGVGKSTLALSLGLRGWSLLSDDWTFVNATTSGLRAWGMQTALKLLPDAVNHFPGLLALAPAASLNGELSFEVDPWNFFSIERAVEARPTLLILLERDASGSSERLCRLRDVEAEELRAAIFGEIEVHPSEVSGWHETLTASVEQLCSLPALKVSVSGTPEAIAANLDMILTERVCG